MWRQKAPVRSHDEVSKILLFCSIEPLLPTSHPHSALMGMKHILAVFSLSINTFIQWLKRFIFDARSRSLVTADIYSGFPLLSAQRVVFFM